MIPAAIYLRVSTKEQAESGESIPAQRERLRAWAEAHGYKVVREYVDAGESARVADRPAFSRLVQDARRKDRPFDAVLVWKWDRFARNAEDAALYKAVLRRECGVQVISISDPPGEGAVGQLIERILDVVAEFQSLMTGEHVRNTMAYLAQQGRWLSKPPYGYRIGEDGRLEPDPDEAEVVRWAFEEVARGRSLWSVAHALAVGEPHRLSASRTWSIQTLKDMLRNPVYRGVARWRVRRYDVVSTANGSTKRRQFRPPEEWIEVEGAHEPIIDQATWEAVQRQLELRAMQRTERPRHVLHGLVRCGRCGSMMYVIHKERRSPRWVCSRSTRVDPAQRCAPVVSIRHPDLLAAVIDRLDAVVRGEGLRPDDLVFAPPEGASARERRLRAVKEQKDRLLKAYLAGVLDLDEFTRERRRLETEERALSTPPPEVDIESLRERMRDFAAAAREALENPADMEAARAVLSRVIHSITVHPDTREVRIRFFRVRGHGLTTTG